MMMKYEVLPKTDFIFFFNHQSLSWLVLNLVLTSRTIKSMVGYADCFNFIIPASHSRKWYQRKIKLKPWIAESDTRKILCARNLIPIKLFFKMFVKILLPFAFICVYVSHQNDWQKKNILKVMPSPKNPIFFSFVVVDWLNLVLIPSGISKHDLGQDRKQKSTYCPRY